MMSEFPPPPVDPIFYASPHVPQKSPRPTSVTVIAVLAIILGSLSVLGTLFSLPQYLGVKLMPNPMMDQIRKDPLVLWVSIGLMLINLAFGILVLSCGVGALSLKPWARLWFVRYAVFYFFYSIISLIFNAIVIQPRMEHAMQSALPANSPLNNPQFHSVLEISRYAGICFGVVFLIWPVAIFYYITRPHVKDAFGRGMYGFGTSGALSPETR